MVKLMLVGGLMFLWVLNLNAQSPLEVGRATDLNNVISIDTTLLAKAFSKTIMGGYQPDSFYILSQGPHHYLIATGTYRKLRKTAAMVLRYDMSSRIYLVHPGDGYVTCTNAACLTCTLFKENGRIVGCKCQERSTISNQCNFFKAETSSFYTHLWRLVKAPKLKPTLPN